MTRANIVEISSRRPLDNGTAREIVAAQLRGEARTEDHIGGRVVEAVATELESCGFVPNLVELERRYGAVAHPQHLRTSA